jgi:2-dehydropantoate 2-reductase
VAVVGAGAVGTLLGGLLAAAGADVTLVDDRVPPDAPADVTIHEPSGRVVAAHVARASRVDDLAEPPDLVVLAVKMFDLAAVLDDLARWPGVPTLTIQNGIGAEELVAAARPGAPLVGASLTSPVERPGAGEVRWRGRGGIALAVVAGDATATADWLAESFAAVGLPARRLVDARAMKWSKLLGNLVGNAVSALADRDPADCYRDPDLFDLDRRQLLETLAVMRAARIPVVALPGADVRLLALAVRLPGPISRLVLRRVVGGARGGKSPSLRLHLRGAAGPTEAAWLNGAVARAGAAAGVPTPVNAALADLLDRVVVDPGLRAALVDRPRLIVEQVDAAPGGGRPIAHGH